MAKRFLTTIQAITATFTGNVSAANPTLPEHLATKEYVDNSQSSVVIDSGSSYPTSASNGQLFYNTNTGRVAVYFNSIWKEILYVSDMVVSGGTSSTVAFDSSIDGGNSSTDTFINNYDGGFS